MPYATTRLSQTGEAQSMREATILPDTWREEDRSVDVVWTTGAAVTRFDWLEREIYDETLRVEPGAVRLDRLQDGGPVLLDHVVSTRTLAGSIVPGSVSVAGGTGRCRIRLSGADDMKDVVSKVRDRHLRTVSVGYIVHTYTRTEAARGQRDTMEATDWEPTEISLTPVPADAGATIRGKNDMPEIIEADGQPVDRTTPRSRAITVETIRERCRRSNDITRSFEQELVDMHAEEPLSRREMDERIERHLIEARAKPAVDAREGRRDAPQDRQRTLFADVLFARMAGKQPTEAAAEFASAGLVDMARALLEARGERVRWMSRGAVIDSITRHGQHTASDFGWIINNAGLRFLVDAFTSAPSPLKVLARKRDFPDFKVRYAVQAEGPPQLRNVPENAEFKRVGFQVGMNGMQLGTYGEIFSISRQALVNDDLGVFSQMASFWARSLAETEASYLVALISGNGITMSEDAKTLYHVDHGNIAATPAAITVASLSAARQQLRTIKNRDGATPANVVPKYLVVGPAKETEAEQALAAINAPQPSSVNPFSGKLELIVDPRLTGNSWRLFADPAVNPVLEYGNLEGQDGLFTDTRIGFEVDGVDFKARTDLGAGAIDYRGTLLNTGA